MGYRNFVALAFVTLALVGCDSLDADIRETLEYVRNQQKDPEATKFQNVVKCRNGSTVTGEVLGKNSYGAFTGWHKFYGNQYYVVVDDGDNYEEVQTQEADCQKSPEQWRIDVDASVKRAMAESSDAPAGDTTTGDATN